MPESKISLVVGLGNPGSRYEKTWHNLGYRVVDRWADRKGLIFKPGRGDYYHLESGRGDRKITVLKPTPFMNLSGHPVAQVARYLKIAPENILVICDDVALPLGALRIRKAGSSGGHNGLDSVISEVGSDQIPRLRIGFWTGSWRGDLADHVLSAIPKAVQTDLEIVLNFAVEALDCVLTQGIDTAMNQYNRNFFEAPGTLM